MSEKSQVQNEEIVESVSAKTSESGNNEEASKIIKQWILDVKKMIKSNPKQFDITQFVERFKNVLDTLNEKYNLSRTGRNEEIFFKSNISEFEEPITDYVQLAFLASKPLTKSSLIGELSLYSKFFDRFYERTITL